MTNLEICMSSLSAFNFYNQIKIVTALVVGYML